MSTLPAPEAFEALAQFHEDRADECVGYVASAVEHHRNSATACRIAAKLLNREAMAMYLGSHITDADEKSGCWEPCTGKDLKGCGCKTAWLPEADAIIAYLTDQPTERE